MKRIAIAIALALLGCACAAAYPDRPIRILVGLPSGSLPDTIARVLGAKLSAALGVPVLVENITGAAGNIAAERLAKAVPDGYTLGVLSQTQIVVNPSLYALPFDPQKAFAPISQLTLSANVLVVNNGVPAKTVSELVALAKAQPGMLTFASGGNGSGTHLASELFRSAAGIDMRHVPYKGATAAIPDLLAGRVSLMFSPIQSVLPWVRDGRLRALAVTSLKRASVLPESPTVAESGFPGFEATLWNGLVAPAATPSEAIRILHAQTVRALAAPEVRDRLAVLGIEEMGNSPQEFAAAIKTETPKWAKIIRAAGIKAD
jgi:tripartite-type tricarboxylate transporter receptor subunit TctC